VTNYLMKSSTDVTTAPECISIFNLF